MADTETPNTGNRSLDMCRRKVSTESFIEEAMQIYGNLYDYSKVDYKNRNTMVTIVCPVHGDFRVYAREHLDGRKCPTCEKSEKFLQKLHDKFGNKFGTEELHYVNSTTPVTLICPTHGAFTRLPQTILNSNYGCPICGNSIIESARQKSHMDAEVRKDEERTAKKAALQAHYQSIIEDFDKIEHKYKALIQKWIDKPTNKIPYDLKLTGAFQLYAHLVENYLNVILYDTNWIDSYRNQHLIPDYEARKLPHFQIGDRVFMYAGEAPHTLIVEDYRKNGICLDTPFDKYLSHRSCDIYFEHGDLFIHSRSYVNGINPTELGLDANVEKYRNHCEAKVEQPRKTATQSAITKFRALHPSFTDEKITSFVTDLYPNIFEDSLKVAIEVLKEIYRNQEELTEDTFKRQLVSWNDHLKLVGYTRVCRKQEELRRKIDEAFVEAYNAACYRTCHLSEYFDTEMLDYVKNVEFKDSNKTFQHNLNNKFLNHHCHVKGIISCIDENDFPPFWVREYNGEIILVNKDNAKRNNAMRASRANHPTDIASGSNNSGCLLWLILIPVSLLTLCFIF